MEKITKVFNLLTGEECLYTCNPETAVKSAYMQEMKMHSQLWNIENIELPVQYGKRVVTCGNWTTINE